MRHRCDEFWKLGKRCPGRHIWEQEEEDDDDDDEEPIPGPERDDQPFYLVLPERNAEVTQLIGLDELAAEAFLMDWGSTAPWREQYPKAAIDYSPDPGYFLPDPLGDRHVTYPTGPAIRAGQPEPSVLVRGRYYSGDEGYAAELFAIAAAALLGITGAYIFHQGAFQNITSFMMGRYLTAPTSVGAVGQGFFFEADTYLDSPGNVFDKFVATVEVGEQPATWY